MKLDLSIALLDPARWIAHVVANAAPALTHPDFPGYVVTLDGRVLGPRKWLVPQTTSHAPYPRFMITSGGKHGLRSGHRLVASVYYGIPFRGTRGSLEVNHLDGRTTVLAAPNLAPCSATENIAYIFRYGLAKHVRSIVVNILSPASQLYSIPDRVLESESPSVWADLLGLNNTQARLLFSHRLASKIANYCSEKRCRRRGTTCKCQESHG